MGKLRVTADLTVPFRAADHQRDGRNLAELFIKFSIRAKNGAIGK